MSNNAMLQVWAATGKANGALDGLEAVIEETAFERWKNAEDEALGGDQTFYQGQAAVIQFLRNLAVDDAAKK